MFVDGAEAVYRYKSTMPIAATPGEIFMQLISEDYLGTKNSIISNAKRLGGSFEGLAVAEKDDLWEDLYIDKVMTARATFDNKGMAPTRQEAINYLYRIVYNGHKRLCGWLKTGKQLQSKSTLAMLIRPEYQLADTSLLDEDGDDENYYFAKRQINGLYDEELDRHFEENVQLVDPALNWLESRIDERAVMVLRMRNVVEEPWAVITDALGYKNRYDAMAAYVTAQKCLQCYFDYPELRGAVCEPKQPIAWVWHAGSRQHAQVAIKRYDMKHVDKQIKADMGIERGELAKLYQELDGLTYAMYGKPAAAVF